MSRTPGRAIVRSAVFVIAIAMAMTGLAACGRSNVRITVTRRTDLVSHPLRLVVTGLDADERVTISARTRDVRGHPWSSSATFVADRGRVDLATSKPVAGSYSAASAYGLFGTMTPVAAGEAQFVPPARDRATLTVTAKGQTLGRTSVVRLLNGPGVTVRRTTVRADGFDGYLYLPPPGRTAKPAVLTFGGSEGYPQLVHAVLPIVPANVAICGYPRCDEPAWTWHGRAVPYTTSFNQPAPVDRPDAVIPDERIDGPMLVVCGNFDQIWLSCNYARAIMRRRRTHHSRYHDVLLEYPRAGHGVGFPVPGLNGTNKQAAGQTPDANALAVGRLWPRLLSFLAHLPA